MSTWITLLQLHSLHNKFAFNNKVPWIEHIIEKNNPRDEYILISHGSPTLAIKCLPTNMVLLNIVSKNNTFHDFYGFLEKMYPITYIYFVCFHCSRRLLIYFSAYMSWDILMSAICIKYISTPLGFSFITLVLLNCLLFQRAH